MARQIRIEFSGAFYHVFSRGNEKQPIFLGDEDRCFFLDCLRQAHERFGAVIHIYCLMPNHFHLILETPNGDLSRVMQFLNTRYTVYFNKKHKRCGHLFQGRYRSVLIEAVGYARELSRYIHLNPVRAKIAKGPDEYPWSSYGYYLGKASAEGWFETRIILGLFDDNIKKARGYYREYVIEGIGLEASAEIKESEKRGILGTEEFTARIKKEYLSEQACGQDRERPQLRKLREKPDLSQILSVSRRILGPGNRLTVPMAISVSHACTRATLAEIGEFFSLSISGISNACSRIQKAVVANAALARAAEEIKREIAGPGEGQTYLLPKNG